MQKEKESDGLCPNHIKNVIKISKIKPEEIEMVLDMITDKWCNPDAPGKTEYIIDFDKIIPEPTTIEECPEDCRVKSAKEAHISEDKARPWFNWYEWHCRYWGTKWGAYNGYTKIGKTYIMLVFSTAWTAPIPIIQRLGVLGYPIEVKYADEDYGSNCGRMKYTSEQGWTHWNELDFKDPVRFARDLWNNY